MTKKLNLTQISTIYHVRRLLPKDVQIIYDLCVTNPMYYEFCPPPLSKEGIIGDMQALPPGRTYDDKFFVGFFAGEQLIAVLDLITHYPGENIAFLGFFMMDAAEQRRGTGSAIIKELLAYLETQNFQAVRLAWITGNPQAEHFWIKNGFIPIEETESLAGHQVIYAEKELTKYTKGTKKWEK